MTATKSVATSMDRRELDLVELVAAASSGDQPSWSEVVRRFAGLVWGVARGYGLSAADAADVSQTVWLRLVEKLRSLSDPAHLPAWLATVSRHESVQTLRRQGREVIDDELAYTLADPAPSPERYALTLESREEVWAALSRLSLRCQALLRALAAAAESHYAQIAEALGMPIGSVGPTRMRCLDWLRRELAAVGGLQTYGG